MEETETCLRLKEDVDVKKLINVFPQALAATVVSSLNLFTGQVMAHSGIIIPQMLNEQNTTSVNVISVTESDSAWIDISTKIDPYLASIYVFSLKVVVSIAATIMMNKFNRRTLLLVSVGGMAVCISLSGLNTYWIRQGASDHTWAPVCFLFLYIAFSSIGIASIPFILAGELFPIQIRGTAYSLILAVSQLFTFAMLQWYFPLYHYALVATVITSMHLVIGQIIGYSGVIIPQMMEEQNITGSNSIPITESDSAWITSAPLLSGLVASLLSGVLTDSIGRLKTIILSGIPGVIGLLLIATASNMSMIIWGRFILGITFMFIGNPTAVYISEISRPDLRGSFLSLMEVFISIGIVVIYLQGWIMHWRTIAWITNAYLIIPIFIISFIPESPDWLVSKRRLDQAKKSLTWFYKYNSNNAELVEQELKNAMKKEKVQTAFREKFVLKERLKMFFSPTFYKPFLILTVIFFLQQFTGIGTEIDPYLASTYISCMKVITACIATVLMNKFNRRTLLLVSAGGMAVCIGLCGLNTYWIQQGTLKHRWIPLCFLLLYIAFSSIGITSIPFAIADSMEKSQKCFIENVYVKTWPRAFVQVLVATVITSMHLVVGQIIGYSGIIVPQMMKEQNVTGGDAIPITESDSAWIASAPLLSGLVASLFAGVLIDSIGRLKTIILSGIPGVIGLVLIATASNMSMIIWGRLVLGITFMFIGNSTAVYISEISKPKLRGSFLTLMEVFIAIGIVLVYLKGWVIHWRTISWITNAYLIIPIMIIFFLPESPDWLVSKRRMKQAKKSLTWFYKYNSDSSELVQQKLIAIEKEQAQTMFEEEYNWREQLKMFLLPTFYKPFLILTVIFLLQQLTEIGTEINPYLASTYISSIKVIMACVTTILMNKFNRRTLLLVSAGGMAVSISLCGLNTYWIQQGTLKHTWIPLCLLVLYIAFSLIGIGSIPFSIAGELFPLKIRGVAYSLIISVANLFGFAVLQFYFPLYRLFGSFANLQYFFATMCLFAMVFIYLFLPETHNFELIDIENHFWKNTFYNPSRVRND
ncbi:hypothetical protein RN001_010553 [Aquatica leii]|uniref:Major facilitator superfamily (MFS) profile domain-containing protein n=1 Tax=Aquatica leii TaxID=1421715 RepID=A0AAN7PWI2_9COLE|nr:hypothetical protein RN001_010553 [Aquatica leii]